MSSDISISGRKKSRFISKLNGKDKKLGIDESAINLKNPDKCPYNLADIIEEVDTKEELYKKITRKMANSIYSNGKPYTCDLSLLIGLNFGTFKLYLTPDMINSRLKEKILKSNPNVKDTQYILDNHINDIYLYMADTHKLKKEKLGKILEKMTTIDDDYYESTLDPTERICAIDIAKIIMGIKIEYDREEIEEYSEDIKNKIRSGEYIKYFDDLNKKDISEYKIR